MRTDAVGGRASRDKGKRGELEACEVLADVWPGLQRTYHQSRAGSDAPDIDGPGCPAWIEVKRQERINIHEAMEQAAEAASAAWTTVPGDLYLMKLDTKRPPVVIHKRNRGEWLVTVRAKDLRRLMGR